MQQVFDFLVKLASIVWLIARSLQQVLSLLSEVCNMYMFYWQFSALQYSRLVTTKAGAFFMPWSSLHFSKVKCSEV